MDLSEIIVYSFHTKKNSSKITDQVMTQQKIQQYLSASPDRSPILGSIHSFMC